MRSARAATCIAAFWFALPFASVTGSVAGSADTLAASAPTEAASCAVAAIEFGASSFAARLRTLPEVDAWVEADRSLLLCSQGPAEDLVARLRSAGATMTATFDAVDLRRLRFWSRAGHSAAPGRTLATGGRWAVVELTAGAEDPPANGSVPATARLRPFVSGTVLARRQPPGTREATTFADEQISTLLAELDAVRWANGVATLAGWNRWTRGSQILSARDWLVSSFGALAGTTVTQSSFPVGANTGWNVIARQVGTSRPNDWYVVGGHYDSTSENPSVAAPGAEDNASGCSGVLELARLFAAHPPNATMIFVCFAGEEQGLYGSEDYVADLVAAGDASKVREVVIFDMIGFTADSELDVLLETEAVGATWSQALLQAAADFTTLSVVQSFSAWGSDHVPFLDHNLAAVLAIENDWDAYPHYHHTTDLPSQLTPQMALQILRMSAGALLRRVGPTTYFADGFESGSTSRWSASGAS